MALTPEHVERAWLIINAATGDLELGTCRVHSHDTALNVYFSGPVEQAKRDAEFYYAARSCWPEALKAYEEAEKRIAELTEENARYREAIAWAKALSSYLNCPSLYEQGYNEAIWSIRNRLHLKAPEVLPKELNEEINRRDTKP